MRIARIAEVEMPTSSLRVHKADDPIFQRG